MRRIFIIDYVPDPPEHTAILLIPMVWLVYMFGLLPYLPKNHENNMMLGIASIVFATCCFTFGWWGKFIPQKWRRAFVWLGRALAAFISVGLPFFFIYGQPE